MAYKKASLNEREKARVNQFLQQYKKESAYVRKEVARTLPAYNSLLNMHMNTCTFEEFALKRIAKNQGLPYTDPLFDYKKIIPPCPHCQEANHIRRVKENTYLCNHCHKKFATNHKSISSGSNLSAIEWHTILCGILENRSIEDIVNRMECCSRTTFYKIRNRLVYAMQILLSQVKLYGEIQVDITFTHDSYRGMTLDDPDYPEDSPFQNTYDYVPREAHKRAVPGNSVSIVTLVDDYGHVLTKFSGLRKATSALLNEAIGKDKILLVVPENDPFTFQKPCLISPKTTPGDQTKIVSDKDGVIIKYAKDAGIPIEAHRYRIRGTQLNRGPEQANIQRVNSIHSKLKRFLRFFNPSTKYLPAYLTIFDFLQNTGGSDAAIEELYSILVTPGLNRPSQFFNDLFTVPNYLSQRLKSVHPLQQFTDDQLLAYYLYDQRQKAINSGEKNHMKVSEICEKTNISQSSISRLYKNLQSSGYHELILHYHQSDERMKRSQRPLKCADPIVLAIFDEWTTRCAQFSGSRYPNQKEFFSEMNEKYGSTYTRGQLLHYFVDIRKRGLREKVYLRDLKEKNSTPRLLTPSMEKGLKIVTEYGSIMEDCRKKGVTIPPKSEIKSALAKKHGISLEKLDQYIRVGRRARNDIGAGKFVPPDDYDDNTFFY